MTHRKPRIERGKTFGMGQIYISRPTALCDVRSQVHLGLDGAAGIQHVCDLQQGQLGEREYMWYGLFVHTDSRHDGF